MSHNSARDHGALFCAGLGQLQQKRFLGTSPVKGTATFYCLGHYHPSPVQIIRLDTLMRPNAFQLAYQSPAQSLPRKAKQM